MTKMDKKIKKYYDLLEHKIVDDDMEAIFGHPNYYDTELRPLLTVNQNGIKNFKIKAMNSDYTTKWLDVNLDSIESITAFLNLVKTDLEGS